MLQKLINTKSTLVFSVLKPEVVGFGDLKDTYFNFATREFQDQQSSNTFTTNHNKAHNFSKEFTGSVVLASEIY